MTYRFFQRLHYPTLQNYIILSTPQRGTRLSKIRSLEQQQTFALDCVFSIQIQLLHPMNNSIEILFFTVKKLLSLGRVVHALLSVAWSRAIVCLRAEPCTH